jgi:acyl-CoA synthetase (AMP-forming)/AMP-acid ligase II
VRGLMMDEPLTLVSILERACRYFPQVEVVSRRPDGTLSRINYSTLAKRVRRLARALQQAGLARGDRVATLMWNHSAHVEAYFGVPLAGGVVHPLNLRLHPDEIAYIAGHAGDRFLIVDDVLWPVFERFRDKTRFERVWAVPFGGMHTPAGAESYETLLAHSSEDFEFPEIDENDAAGMCFTSGTTGRSKGVLYSHRSIVLHSMAECMTDCLGLCQNDTCLVAVPMFHVNAWGLPYTCPMAGSKMVLTGCGCGPEELLDLMEQEGVTLASGVPTIWLGVLEALRKNPGGWKFRGPVRMIVGGAAPPENLIRALDRFGLRIIQGWGMTETSPLATASLLKEHMRGWNDDRKYEVRSKQGYAVPFIRTRLMRPEGEAPWDGATPGELEVRGPWVSASYYNAPEAANRWSPDGWFRTGDVATIDPEGYVKIVDRAKDLIKSGGEWISSVDLENALMAHPAVREAAVIAIPDEKWQERPLAVIVLRDGVQVTPAELEEFLSSRFAKWQIPEGFVFASEIPRTSVGKFLKSKLREQYRDWRPQSGSAKEK